MRISDWSSDVCSSDLRDPYGVTKARERLHVAYDWLEGQIGEEWAAGDAFTLADCSAAPSLFYADWVEEIGGTRPRLKAYRARLQIGRASCRERVCQYV